MAMEKERPDLSNYRVSIFMANLFFFVPDYREEPRYTWILFFIDFMVVKYMLVKSGLILGITHFS